MIQRPTLFVLAEAAEIGLPEAATVPARAFDPILRPFIKKAVQRAVDAASARTTSRNGDHLLRLAFLGCHEAAPKDLDPNDERATAQAFDTLAAPYLPPREDPDGPSRAGAYRTAAADREPTTFGDGAKRPKRRWPITVPASIVAVLATVATASVFLVPRLLPSPAARFRKTAFGTALGEPLGQVVVATGRGDSGDNAEARKKLLSPEVKAQIGNEAFESLTRAIDELPHVRPERGEQSIDDALAPLFLEVNELDARLAAKKVPAYLHAYGSGASGRTVVWLTAYFVEQREELTFDGAPIRFVWGRRLDSLNLADSGLYKADAEDWGIVSMDRLEQEFVQTLLAPIAKGAPIAPDDGAPEKSARAELSVTAGRVIAAELVSATRVSTSDAASLHRAIAQRNELAGSLVKVGYRFPATSDIELPAATLRRVKQAKDEYPRDRALLEEFLRVNERATSYRRDLAPAVAALVRLEEEELGGKLAERKHLQGVKTPMLDRGDGSTVNRETAAASLALVARPQACPRLALWRMVRALFDTGSSSGDAEVAVAVGKPLLFRLNLLPRDGSSYVEDTEAFTRAVTAALELPPERVRDAARETYKEIFGREPQSLVRKALP